jgi:error-prone DNA polymerase
MTEIKTYHEGNLFREPVKSFTLPPLEHSPVEDAYDEIELLGFPVSCSWFGLLKTAFRGGVVASELYDCTGKTVRLLGSLVTRKYVTTVRKELMIFGTWFDREGRFFDTVHFPPSLKLSPFTGSGVYLLEGRVVEEFGFPSVEVSRMARLPFVADPRFA